jgi:HEAT repeat protein
MKMLSRFVFSIAMILINGLNGPVIPLQNDMSELVADLSSPDAQQRARAACLLGKKGRNAESAVPALIRILDDATPVERPACGDERWKSNEETSPGREAAVALSDMGRQTLDPLIDALADDSWVTRMHAALALGLIEDRRAVEPLTVRLTDEVPRVRARVAWALGMIEDHEGVGALTAVLTDESPDVREQAAWALGNDRRPGRGRRSHRSAERRELRCPRTSRMGPGND